MATVCIRHACAYTQSGWYHYVSDENPCMCVITVWNLGSLILHYMKWLTRMCDTNNIDRFIRMKCRIMCILGSQYKSGGSSPEFICSIWISRPAPCPRKHSSQLELRLAKWMGIAIRLWYGKATRNARFQMHISYVFCETLWALGVYGRRRTLYVHTYMHTYRHTCMHAYIHTYVYMHTYVCMYTYIHTYTCPHAGSSHSASANHR